MKFMYEVRCHNEFSGTDIMAACYESESTAKKFVTKLKKKLEDRCTWTVYLCRCPVNEVAYETLETVLGIAKEDLAK